MAAAGFLLLMLVGTTAARADRQVVDATGVAVRLPDRPLRIVSLGPDLTEILFAIGAGERLVGVSEACDRPPQAARLPRVGSLMQPSIEAVLALRPDLVLATSQGNPLETLVRLRTLGAPVVGLAPAAAGLEGVVQHVRAVADAAGEGAAGERVAANLAARIAVVRATASTRPRARACFLLWMDPLVGAGPDTFIHGLLAAAGVDDACARGPAEYPRLSREEVLLARPELLVLATGMGSAAGADVGILPDWVQALPAVAAGRVLILDDRALRPTPSLAAAAEELLVVLAGLPPVAVGAVAQPAQP